MQSVLGKSFGVRRQVPLKFPLQPKYDWQVVLSVAPFSIYFSVAMTVSTSFLSFSDRAGHVANLCLVFPLGVNQASENATIRTLYDTFGSYFHSFRMMLQAFVHRTARRPATFYTRFLVLMEQKPSLKLENYPRHF